MTADATPAAKPAAKKPASRARAQADVIDQLTAALAKPADDAERQKVETFIDSKITQLVAERGIDRPRNIIEALTEVMRRVAYVGKDSRNSHGNFNFRGIDAVVNALGPAMREVGVIVTPGVARYQYGDVEVGQNRTKQAHVQVEVTYGFHYSNADGAISSIEASVAGEAMDSGDKATAKAMSVAMRIALLQTFALPTTEPDPDAYSYERSAAPRHTPRDVYTGIQWASEMDDLDAAHEHIKNTIGAELLSIMVTNKAGEEVRADRYVEQAIEAMREQRARAVAEQQDAAADAPQAPPAEPAEPAHAQGGPVEQDARTQDAQESAPAPDQPRAQESAPAQAPAQDAPAQTADEKLLAMVKGELAYQAQVLGVPFPQYTSDLIDSDGKVLLPKARAFAKTQREQVIHALRAAGESAIADRYDLFKTSAAVPISEVIDGPAASVPVQTAAPAAQ